MIGKIKGTLVETDNNSGLIETSGGVFYKVFLPAALLTRTVPTPVEIYTYLQVREDALILFGFNHKKEHDLFLLLLTVSGVGPKTAYLVCSRSKPEELIHAIQDNNVDYFTQIPGLGRKTSMKILLELSQKMKGDFQLEKMYLSEDDNTFVDALVSLGFKAQDAKNILKKIPKEMPLEEKIKEGIRMSSKNKK